MKLFYLLLGAACGTILSLVLSLGTERGPSFMRLPTLVSSSPRLPRITTKQFITAEVTAYDPYDKECVDRYADIWPRKTPGGTDPETPGAATDNSILPLGTKIIIPNVGTYIVDDTGGEMRKAARRIFDPIYWIDIRIPAPYKDFPNDHDAARKKAHEIAKRLGARREQVEVIPPPDVHE